MPVMKRMYPNKLLTRRYADISTCHITKEDNDLLLQEVGKDLLLLTEFEYGYFLRLFDDEHYANTKWQEIRDLGYSKPFIRLLKRCVKEGFQGICLDQAGAEYNELPSFEW